MTVRAADEPFVHTMPEGHAKSGLGFRMAAIAECGLLVDQQTPAFLCEVRRMTGDATHPVSSMVRLLEPEVLLFGGVAGQAAFRNNLRSSFLKVEDLGLVAAAVDVLSARTVAGLAAVRLRAGLGLQKIVPMAGFLQAIKKIFCAAFGHLCSHVIPRSWARRRSRAGRHYTAR